MEKIQNLRQLSKRLKDIRERRDLNQVELAELLGVSAGSVGNWEAQINMPTRNRLRQIAEKLSVSLDYLLGDDEADYSPAMLKDELPIKNDTSRIALEREKIRLIPVVSWARAGEATNYSDLCEQIDEWVESRCPDPNAFALIIEGDSMEPEFRAGDRVIFAPNSEARNGDYVVVRKGEDGGVMFKKFRRTGEEGRIIRLESLNPNYKIQEYPAEVFRFIYPAVDMKRLFPR